MRVIIGAGCAGLGLARALVDQGVDEPLVVLDRRTSFGNDRTWCFWQTEPEVPRSEGATHAWSTWEFVGRDGERVRHTSRRHPYVCVPADRYYEASLEALARSPSVDVRIRTRVGAVDRRDDGQLVVQTSNGPLVADAVVDATGGAGGLGAPRPAGAIELRQSFLGLEVETDEPAFDPAVATLMDFRTGGGPDGGTGLHFVYVLPTSPTRALVEHTTLGPATLSPRVRRGQIAEYLADHWGVDHFEVAREERGVLPMTTHRFPLTHGPGIAVVGTAAGAIRPSSGYAFTRIQHHVEAVAASIARQDELPRQIAPARHAVLDLLFLRALAVDPHAFERTLLALAARTSADRFARFMSGASSVADEVAIMRALARAPFLTSMLGSSLLRPIDRR